MRLTRQIGLFAAAAICLSVWAEAKTATKHSPATTQRAMLAPVQQPPARLQISHAAFDPIRLTIHTTGLSTLNPQDQALSWFQQLYRTFKRNLDLCGVFQLQQNGRAAHFVTLDLQKHPDGKLQVRVVVQSNIGVQNTDSWRSTYTLTNSSPKHEARILASRVHQHFTRNPGPFLDPIVAVKKIVDPKTRKPFSQLVLLAMDGSLLKVLTRGSFDNVLPSITANGCSLFYTSYQHNNPSLVRMDLRKKQRSNKGTKAAVIFNQPGMSMGASSFPSGQLIFTHSPLGGKSNLYRLDPSLPNAVAKPLLHPLSFGLKTSAHVHPQGKSVLFVTDAMGSPRIRIMDANGANPRPIVQEGTFHGSPRFIPPDGEEFVFVARDQQSKQMDLFIARLPQTQQNLFATLRPALTQNQGNNLEPYPSPNGELIAFISTRIKGTQDIYITTRDGSHQRRITSDGPYFMLAWSPLCKE